MTGGLVPSRSFRRLVRYFPSPSSRTTKVRNRRGGGANTGRGWSSAWNHSHLRPHIGAGRTLDTCFRFACSFAVTCALILGSMLSMLPRPATAQDIEQEAVSGEGIHTPPPIRYWPHDQEIRLGYRLIGDYETLLRRLRASRPMALGRTGRRTPSRSSPTLMSKPYCFNASITMHSLPASLSVLSDTIRPTAGHHSTSVLKFT